MSSRSILPVICAIGLLQAACASTTATTISQGMEKVDSDAAAAYATVASLCNAAEAVKPSAAARCEGPTGFKTKSWGLFVQEHNAYKLGQSFDISGLLAIVAAAKGL